jgi:hypothetical protein
MSKKPKFRPRITRVKLNPEQAVLACSCYDTRKVDGGTWHPGTFGIATTCVGRGHSFDSNWDPGSTLS